MKKRLFDGHYPLHITISTLFIVLIVLFGSLLGWYNYKKTSEILLSSSEQIFDQLGQELSLDYLASYQSVSQAISMLGHSEIADSFLLEERLEFLAQFRAALQVAREMTALYVGYGNGDFFLVRSLDNDAVRSKFSAPAGAAFLADNITTGIDGRRYLQRIWFSDTLVELRRTPPQLTEYDPRIRPWYKAALATDDVAGVDPYLFYFLQEVGYTLAYKSPGREAVIAGDITLKELSRRISLYKMTENSEIVLFHEDGKVVAYQDTTKLLAGKDATTFTFASISDLGNDVLTYAAKRLRPENSIIDFPFKGETWFGGVRRIELPRSDEYFLLFVSPKKELLARAMAIQKRAAAISLILILFTVPVTWLTAKAVANPLRLLAGEAEQINRFDFSQPTQSGSVIKEVDDLASAMGMMKKTISEFLTLIESLASEQNFDDMLELITKETMRVSQADGAVAYLVDDKDGSLHPGVCVSGDFKAQSVELLPIFERDSLSPLTASLKSGSSTVIHTIADDSGNFDCFISVTGGGLQTLVVLPLQSRQKEDVGVLCLFYKDRESFEDTAHQDRMAFLQTFSGLAAVSLESRKMFQMQKELLESFIKLLAGAIDSKSPYTGGHCQRIPVLTRLLAQKACETKEGAYADFTMSEQEWEALHIASWLHDCGKVTIPEYVVDKATKLETLHDRIHEIRMRFEVMRRDAHIRYWQGVAAGGKREELQDVLEKEWYQLDLDYAFVAQCNLGGESMAPDRLLRLESIASQTWLRSFDDRIGISWEEKQRKERTPAESLPVTEPLIGDKEEHLLERTEKHRITGDNAYGFVLDVPAYLNNRGELYNLKIPRGTLNEEERYLINDHIVQTIVMLKELPYPKHLRDVPDIAGGHHEKIDGTGYPRCLRGDQLLPQAKMMAIADIFEALTASDRPYRKLKTLSEAIRILAFIEQDGHIDSDLFRLFLSSGAYLEYAREYLHPEQLDEVEVGSYLS